MSTLQALDDGEFWLPSQFLDDDVFVEKKISGGFKNTAKPSFSPFDFPYGFNGSNLNSSVESTFGSTGSTESDEEDIFLAALTKKLVHSAIEDDFSSLERPSKGWGVCSSPQSTLCGCNGATWDLLNAAAGEVAKMRASQQLYGWNRNNHFITSNHSHPALYNNLQVSQFEHLRQQQLMRKQQQQYHCSAPVSLKRVIRPNASTHGNENTTLPGLSPTAWPPLTQARTGSAMPAVFPQTKRECAGTGVFLPRRVGGPIEPRKKPVLLPAKVVHALNLNMEDVGPTRVAQVHPARFNDGFSEKRNMRPHVVNLPSEWTY